MKKLYTFFFTILLVNINCQVLISDQYESDPRPHESAILEIRSTNKGIMLPKIEISPDGSNIQNAPEGLLFYNTNTNKLNFWDTTKFSKNLEGSDAQGLIPETKNIISENTGPTTISSYSNINYTIDSDTTGWTDLKTTLNLKPTKNINSILVNLEGMAAANNSSSNTNYSFAIGIFVNGKLKIVRKFYANDSGQCLWKKFDLTGIFKNLPVLAENESYELKVYGKNLSSGSSSINITYGGPGGTCSNINTGMAKINLSVQITE